jgi:hypothetical protein
MRIRLLFLNSIKSIAGLGSLWDNKKVKEAKSYKHSTC